MVKECFIDLETTGLDPVKNGVLQIAGHIEIEGEKVESFNIECRPFADDEVAPQALAVNGIELESLKDRQDPREAFLQLKKLLSRYVAPFEKTDKFWFYAYNAPFDSGFLREFFKKNGDKYYGSWFWTPAIDIMVLAASHLREERHLMENFRLSTVAAHLGVAVAEEELHDGRYDVRLMREILRTITNEQTSFRATPTSADPLDKPTGGAF